MSPTAHRRPFLLLLTALVAGLAIAGCSGGDDTVAVTEPSSEQGEGTVAADVVAYCETAETVSADGGGLDLSEDAAGALTAIEQLAAAAPQEISGDFETFLAGVAGLAELGDDDPEALSRIFELMMDPEFESAANAIEEYTAAECGIELGAGMGAGAAGSDTSGTDGSDPGEIELEDVDAVKDANDGATWVDKLSTTVINGSADVQVSSSDEDLDEPEAVAACTTIWQALSEINPDVSVEVANGDNVVARSTGDGCDAV
jgi:hypothetical protein